MPLPMVPAPTTPTLFTSIPASPFLGLLFLRQPVRKHKSLTETLAGKDGARKGSGRANRKLAATNQAPHDASALNSDATKHQIITTVARSADQIRIFRPNLTFTSVR